jgi:hypothetical protein
MTEDEKLFEKLDAAAPLFPPLLRVVIAYIGKSDDDDSYVFRLNMRYNIRMGSRFYHYDGDRVVQAGAWPINDEGSSSCCALM